MGRESLLILRDLRFTITVGLEQGPDLYGLVVQYIKGFFGLGCNIFVYLNTNNFTTATYPF